MGASTQSREIKYIPRMLTQQEIAKYKNLMNHTKWKVIHLRITRYFGFVN